MKKLNTVDLLKLIPPNEGEITQRFGRIGQGKTYGATSDVFDEVRRGRVVYVNWKIDFEGWDQRKDILFIIGGLLFPWKKTYYHFPKENLRFIAVDENFVENFGKLTNCSVYLDEGHVVFDSYEMARMSMEKRVSVLHTRHFDRSIHIISQRPTAIHRMLRANVNRFYEYKKLSSWPFLIFMRTEYQDMTEETVDLEKPISRKFYFAKKRIMEGYNSKYMRGSIEDSQTLKFDAYTMNYLEKIKALLDIGWNALRALARKRTR